MTSVLCAAPFVLPNASNLAVVRAALARSPRCRVFFRRAFHAHSPANPFAWETRASLLARALEPAERDRIEFLPLREPYDDERLLAQMGPGPATWVHGGDAPVHEEVLPPGWSFARVDGADGDAEAVQWLHGLYLADDPAAHVASSGLPEPTVAFLQDWITHPVFDTVRADGRQIAKERQAWSVAPYPVVLVTVDAVVRAGDHVLLIRRGRSPGKGLWAIPGGFLEPTEPVLDAALRELVEETGLPWSRRQALGALRGTRVFAHPQRSQRGRVITHAYYFDLGDLPPPPVQGADDAAAAEWVPLARLRTMEAQLHDDHFHILGCFLALAGAL
jgi:bifunctional NMN adenylyltransferase/nudix hydrolase